MKLIPFLIPLLSNPMAFAFLTSLQYRTQRPQWMQKEGSFSQSGCPNPLKENQE